MASSFGWCFRMLAELMDIVHTGQEWHYELNQISMRDRKPDFF
jgi:hypothetical protein